MYNKKEFKIIPIFFGVSITLFKFYFGRLFVCYLLFLKSDTATNKLFIIVIFY